VLEKVEFVFIISTMHEYAMSALLESLSGVPQGSVISPLLFLRHFNDLPDWILSSIQMFADDTKLTSNSIAIRLPRQPIWSMEDDACKHIPSRLLVLLLVHVCAVHIVTPQSPHLVLNLTE